ncbi:hypothetical protein AVM11_12130 [Sphingomonas melonis TY]|uniref:Uncharacterized protein n=1 Tax=Sphingomonas melonis TY TaxID=621456 RepID=A0A175XYW3_9SPHN|nr:hypothetical protein BJP26_14130 [Sphingomonas melonis TY]KZB93607.1 hypothetical protein AVM11_12130 [Sphingomonas melonis TY]
MDDVARHQKQEKFRADRDAIVAALEDQRAAIVQHIDAPEFLSTYFPQIAEMEELFATLASAFREAAERHRRTREWVGQDEALRDRFRLGSAQLLSDVAGTTGPWR